MKTKESETVSILKMIFLAILLWWFLYGVFYALGEFVGNIPKDL